MEHVSELELAIIGVGLRFPGANNPDEYWNNLVNGINSIYKYSAEELLSSGIPDEIVNDKKYIRNKGVIKDADCFDPEFFSYSPKDAEIMDPQHRILLEIAYETLEMAGYADQGSLNTGVFVGVGHNNYYDKFILPRKDIIDKYGTYQISQGNSTDFCSTRISYKLNLKGPSYDIQTACSTSLVAVHIACQSLLSYECDMAIAGGAKLMLSGPSGYHHMEGSVLSSDGYCRPFDANASGFVPGEGAGTVLIKRLEDAIADNDNILAVIKASSVNNDGADKVGFTAPSISGQASSIRTALDVADINSESINYVEAHGTGTNIGDPIEIEALKQAFKTKEKQFCALGSVKANIGHLDTAAGIAGLIKVVLMLRNKKLVPSINYNIPNEKCDFENSPFYLNTKFQDWKNITGKLRAGVSSFGIGGTNAHVILEEYINQTTKSTSKDYSIIRVSAKSKEALKSNSVKLLDYLKKNKDLNIGDVEYTLSVSRKHFNFRNYIVADSISDLINKLGKGISDHQLINENQKKIVFMFSGQGSQYLGMARDLYNSEPFFREVLNNCLSILARFTSIDFKNFLIAEDSNEKISDTIIAQPLLFIVEYSLAKLFIYWGISPDIMIGHSLGEYTAACISGAINLEDIIRLVVRRAELMHSMPMGKMLNVAANEESIKKHLNSSLSIAAVNSEKSTVIAGDGDSMEEFKKYLDKQGLLYSDLHTSHAFHSYMMDPILDDFKEEFQNVQFNTPKIPFLSNVSGTVITPNEVTSPEYWAQHIRSTVLFEKGLQKLLNHDNSVFIEVGPGKTLTSLVDSHSLKNQNHKLINTIRHPKESVDDNRYLAEQIGKLWSNGVDIDINAFYKNETRSKIHLPTYAFQKQKYRIKSEALSYEGQPVITNRKRDIKNWLYKPIWEQSNCLKEEINLITHSKWLIFSANSSIDNSLIKLLKNNSQTVFIVKIGKRFAQLSNNNFQIRVDNEADLERLFDVLFQLKVFPDRIIFNWSQAIRPGDKQLINLKKLEYYKDLSFHALVNIARTIGKKGFDENISITSITSNLFKVFGNENVSPITASILGPAKIIPIEYSNINCKVVDITNPKKNHKLHSCYIINEINSNTKDNVIAIRGNYRWLKKYRQIDSEEIIKTQVFRDNGVYIITGGFGGMGYTFAKYLAKNYNAKLVLISRRYIHPRDEWEQILEKGDRKAEEVETIRKIKTLESFGSKLLYYSSDISSHNKLKKIISEVKKTYLTINGVLHTAGQADYAGIMQNRTKDSTQKILAPKINGTLVLYHLLKNDPLDFFVCFSSIGNQLYNGKFGQVAYNGANEFLDCFSSLDSPINLKTINWNDWEGVGMVEAIKEHKGENAVDYSKIVGGVLTPEEGVVILNQALKSDHSNIIISDDLIENNFKKINEKNKSKEKNQEVNTTEIEDPKFNRPDLRSKYEAPTNPFEIEVAEIFKSFFGYDKVGINDDFFDLGGDSLKALSIVSMLNKNLGINISLQKFLSHSTIKLLNDNLNHNYSATNNTVKVTSSSYFIESNRKSLYCTLFKSEMSRTSRGLVLCPPIGSERIQSNYAIMSLAQRMAKQGFPVLVLDYLGCGNSEGDLHDSNMKEWQNNINRAKDFLVEKTDIDKVSLIGLRLGASIATLAAKNISFVDSLILWEPVLNGKTYLKEIQQLHKKWLLGSFTKEKNNHNTEILGFTYSQSILREIAEINLLDNFKEYNKSILFYGKTNNPIVENESLENVNNFSTRTSNSNNFWEKQTTERAKRLLPDKDISEIIDWVSNLDSTSSANPLKTHN